MTLASDLNLLTINTQNTVVSNAETFLDVGGIIGLTGFLQSEARKGKRYGRVHISNGKNPQSMRSGFATISGELSIINSPLSPGSQPRNGVLWMYFNMEQATRTEFATVVNNFVTDLTTIEGLTVGVLIGTTAAELEISW